MDVIKFSYKDSKGNENEWALFNWVEVGRYIQGTAQHDNKFRTFRKDRVLNYLEDSHTVLREPHTPPPPKPETKPHIVFTGFPSVRKAELTAIATASGLDVRAGVTQSLAYLCGGENAGPKKLEKARAQGCFILDEQQFLRLLETGEVPD